MAKKEQYVIPEEKMVCYKCKKSKYERNFYRSVDNAVRIKTCKLCYDAMMHQKHVDEKLWRGYVRCIGCHKNKKEEEYSFRTKNAINRNKTCDDCISKKRNEMDRAKRLFDNVDDKVWQLIREFKQHGF